LANQKFFILFFLGLTVDLVFSIIAGIVIYRKGFKPALYFLIGMIVYYLGQYVYLSTLWGFYPLTFWTYQSNNLGCFGEILLFTLGLTYKINLLKLEREQAVEEQLRLSEANRHLVETQKQALEEQVEQRTAELKASQAQLIQKEKLASLGELTAGIAHEIQNPLNFVNNFSEVSSELVEEMKEERKKALEERDEALEEELLNDLSLNLEKITLHGKRASNIVKGMLEHSRTTSGEKQLTDLNALAEEYLRLAFQGQRTKDKTFNCTLQINFDPNLPRVHIVPQEIGRVLMNLYSNAFYAVLEQAKQDEQPYEPIVSISTSHQNNRVEIRVKDNGKGIPIGIREKIFQPFFTTKPTGEGTGLGLSLSYDIVTKGHRGEMTAESQEGKGAEFIIRLPLGS
jgi:signal transduction histidine kinase